MKPNRPHPFQTHDSTFHVLKWGAGWVVEQHWWAINARGEEDNYDTALHFADTEAKARAWLTERGRTCSAF